MIAPTPDRSRYTLLIVGAVLFISIAGGAYFLLSHSRALSDAQLRNDGAIKEKEAALLELQLLKELREAELEQLRKKADATQAELQRAHDAFEAASRKNEENSRRLEAALAPKETRVEEVHAKVLAVKVDVGLVMLSAGTNDKVKPGDRFDVMRGDKIVARLLVDKVYPDMCSAKINLMVDETAKITIEDTAVAKYVRQLPIPAQPKRPRGEAADPEARDF